MSKTNIFQGNEIITNKVAEVLGYPNPNGCSYFTQDIYTQSFFYLTKRFGNCKIYDDYKDGGVWNFNVKQYTIQAYLNSSWLTFMVFGDRGRKMMIAPYWTKYNREYLRKKDQMITIYRPNNEEWSDAEKKIVETLYPSFLKEYSIDETNTTQEEWNEKYSSKWFKCLQKHNNETIGLDYEEITAKYGTVFQNSYTRHALRTLEQFLKNMLTPIWVRDVPYNIKGGISDEEASNYSRYDNNIKIELDHE